jgi:hypothetical protein
MSRPILLALVVAGSFSLLFASSASAQVYNRNQAMKQQQQQQRSQRIKTGGTFVSGNTSQIQITTNTNQSIAVTLGPKTEVSVSGTAEQDYLKSGVIVEFVAEVAKGGAVAEKISHLVVVSPSTDRPAGLYPPESTVLGKKIEKEEKAVGGRPKAGADAGIADAPVKPAKNRADSQGGDTFGGKPAKTQKTPQFPASYAVRGTIKLSKNGAITVSTGRVTVKAELASDATIDVDMSDLKAVQRDDRVTVSGYTTQAQPNFVLAESIKIELANPLTGTKKHASKAAKTPAADKAKKAVTDAADLLGGGQ